MNTAKSEQLSKTQSGFPIVLEKSKKDIKLTICMTIPAKTAIYIRGEHSEIFN